MSDDLDKRLSVHEAICAQRYENIEKRLGDGNNIGYIKDTHCKQTAGNIIVNLKAIGSWVFNEITCSFAPPENNAEVNNV